MTSPENNLRYLPFWTLYDYLDDTPPHPFVSVYVLKTYTRNAQSPEGSVSYEAANLAIYKPDSELVAEDIPVNMLISPDALTEWAGKISNWFTDHADKLVK